MLNPKEIILGVRGYLNDFGPRSEEPLLGKYISQEAAFQCTTCGACEFQCPVGIEHLPIIIGLRRGAVNTGKWEDDYGTKLFLALERNGNALGFGATERDKFIQKQEFPIFDGTQEYCLWLGCMGAYDPQGREIIAVVRARDAAPRHHASASCKKEKCTGDPARRLGNDLAVSAARRSRISKPCSRTRSRRSSPSARTACAPSATDWKEFGAPPRDRASQRVPGAPSRTSLPPRPDAARERSSITTPATWAAIATSTTSRARCSRAPAR